MKLWTSKDILRQAPVQECVLWRTVVNKDARSSKLNLYHSMSKCLASKSVHGLTSSHLLKMASKH